MKTLNKSVVIYTYKNEAFENLLSTQNERIIKEIVIPKARDYGETNRPEPEITNGQAYIGEIHSEYKNLITEAKDINEAEVQNFKRLEDEKISIQQQEELKSDIEENQEQTRIKKSELARYDPALIEKDKKWKRIRWFLYLIMLADIVIASSVFEIMGLSLIGSFIIGIGLALALLFFSEKAPQIIRSGRTKLQRILIELLLSAVVITVFYSLAKFRVIQLSENVDVFKDGLNPWIFVTINYFVFAVVTIVSFYSKPTEDEEKILNEINLKQRELKDLESKGASLKSQSDNQKSQHLEDKITSAQVLLYAMNCELRILSLYHSAYQKFISTNLHYRRDRKVPTFFNHEPPSLPTFYQKGDTPINTY